MASSTSRIIPLISQFLVDSSISCVALLGIYNCLSSKEMCPKRKSWILSIICSLGMSLGSLPYVHQLAYQHHFNTGAMVYQDDPLSRFLVTYFMTFLILDLGIGRREYPSEIGFLTGYFHHSLYLLMGIYALYHRFAIASVSLMPMEIPTLIMALGRVYKPLRSEALFGLTFFSTRIVYLAFILHAYYQDINPRIALWPLGIPMMAMHLFWFYGFIQQQLRRFNHHHSTTTPNSTTVTKETLLPEKLGAGEADYASVSRLKGA